MLDFLRTRASARKLRLFACACSRRIGHLLPDERARRPVEVAELYADGGASESARREVFLEAREAAQQAECPDEDDDDFSSTAAASYHAARAAAESAAEHAESLFSAEQANLAIGYSAGFHGNSARNAEALDQCRLLRHLIGNPFRPLPAPIISSSAVVALAQALYAGEPVAFALHDALLDADLGDLAAHFKESEHPKGCWALDLILGKS
jgi:hypothetical protein